MTLIVARAHGDSVTAVSDTKITYDPRSASGLQRTVRSYETPVLKLALVRRDLAIGVAGENPACALKHASQFWAGATKDLRQELRLYTEDHNTGFIVCTLNPAQIWRINGGVSYDRALHELTCEGDSEPFNTFRQLYDGWPDDDVPLRLLASMQGIVDGPWSTSNSTVGGHTIHLITGSEGFEYLANQSAILSHTPGNNSFFHQHYATGTGDTPGAIAFFISERRTQLLFLHQQPWYPVEIQATTIPNLLESAATQYGQNLAATESMLH